MESRLNTNSGLGLKNVQKRLALIYPGQYELQILEDPAEYSVWMKIILGSPQSKEKRILIKKEIAEYELA